VSPITALPFSIADFEAHCALCDDRLWRFQLHVIRPLSWGSGRPALIWIAPGRL
jgi:hypothetical protein